MIFFFVTDSDAGMSKVEANDVMHSAGGGGAAAGINLGADFSKQQFSQSNATNSNEHANNNINYSNAPVSSSYHRLHSQSHGAQNTSCRSEQLQQVQSSHVPNRRSPANTLHSQSQRNTNGVSAIPAEPLLNVESEVVNSSDVTDPCNQSKSRTAAVKQKKKCEVM